MLAFQFEHADLARVRFAVSPLTELWQSVRALQNPASEALHPAWIAETRKRLGDLDLSMLFALEPPRGLSPDFIHPPPSAPLADFEDELARMLSTPPDRVRREVLQTRGEFSPSAALRPFLEEPDAAVAELGDVLWSYWDQALAPHWERMRAVLDGDVLYRARQTAHRGAQGLFGDLDPRVRFQEQRLMLDLPWDGTIDLSGRGLLLVPSVFIWPVLAVIEQAPWQPAIIYAARGSALLWEPAPPARKALSALIGPRRASILTELDMPRSTSDVAHRLGVRPGNVSQHLAVLHDAGLVTRQRVGRVVLYARSRSGETLVNGRIPDLNDAQPTGASPINGSSPSWSSPASERHAS